MASSSSRLNGSSSSAILLSEDDIPGGSLLGREPEELKTAELRLWLKCRGDSCKGLKTKVELVKRVHEYVRTGKDKYVFDPDPDKIYSRRKERSSTSTNVTSKDGVSVQFPVDGWSTSLKRMPMFTRLEMNCHIMESGKSIADKEHHTVPTALMKAKRFLGDEYLEDIQCASDQWYFFVKSKCCRSFRKHDQPHTLQIALCRSACCSCVAGKVGFCNHVLALMFKLYKFSLFNFSTTKDLSEEDDEHVPLACTSQLQQWHKKGGGANIAPQPIMEVQVNKTKDDDDARSRSGLKCLLYEARMKTVHDKNAEQVLKNTMRNIDPNMGLSQMANVGTEDNDFKDTRFGPCQVGSYLCYQVAVTESNFKATASIDCIPRLQAPNKEGLNFPCFPLRNVENMAVPENLSQQEIQLVDTLRHKYAQMAVTGARWCDFIVYTSKGLYVQRIPFDPIFWRNLKQKLLSYYFTHFIKFASAKKHDGNCQVVSADSGMVLQYVTTSAN